MFAQLAAADTQTHIEEAGNLVPLASAIAAFQRKVPGQGAYQADQTWWTREVMSNYLGLHASRAQLEAYYKLIPPIARGHLVPAGYPVGSAGLDLQNTTVPRIVGLTPGNPMTTAVAWVPSGVPGAVKAQTAMKLAAFVKQPGTVEVVKGVTWFNPKLGVWASYAPHILFNDLFQQGRVRADPTAGYYREAVNAWQETPYLKSLLLDAVVVAAAIAGAYALAPLNGTASASLATTTVSAGAAPTASAPIADTLPASVGTPIATVSAPVAPGIPVSAAAAGATGATGGGSVLSTVTGAVGTGAKAVQTVGGTVAAAAGLKAALSGPKSPAAQAALAQAQAAPPASPLDTLKKLLLPVAAAVGGFLLIG